MSILNRIEAIPGFATGFYSVIARRAPFLRDLHREVAKEVTGKLSLGRILDVGTGPGYLPILIAKGSRRLEIVGVDLAHNMVKIARRNAEAVGVSGRVKFQLGDAASLPFEDGHFDFVMSTFSLHHWQRPVKCLREISRVLKENGEAWVYEFRRDTTKDVNRKLRARYGWFMSFLLLNFVRAHSSMSLRRVEDILASVGTGFSEWNVEDRGVVMKLLLSKPNKRDRR